MTDHDAYETAVKAVRFLSVDAIEKAKSGHPGAPMGQANLAVEIFAKHLRFNPQDPAWPNRDRFILSCGHASMLMYSMLHLTGYEVSLDDIKNFRQWGSNTPGHPEFGETPGVETTTGPLGQGVGNAVGMALASKMMAARLNTADEIVIDYNVYGICSDGDLMEGVAYESASIAGHLRLDNLVLIYDDNQITIDGSTDLILSDDVKKRFEGMGWFVEKVNGHDTDDVNRAVVAAKAADRPALIIARTSIGYGSPNKQDKSASHGSPLGADEVKATKEAAGWPLEPTFHVPAEAYAAFADRKAKNDEIYAAWTKLAASLDPERRSRLDPVKGQVPANLLQELVTAVGDSDDATRNHAGRVEQKVAELCPQLVGGSADLACSVQTTIQGSPAVSAGSYSGRNLHFGVREHGMGAVQNGLALSGSFVPFVSTFLIFGDYMRPPMRLAGLMKQQAIYIFSHDSVFLGEDGPTHQPVEQLWTMRMVPNLDVFRPADGLETAAAWSYAMNRSEGPTVLSLTRHKVPALERPAGFDPKQVLNGAYVLVDVEDPELVLIATGSEVSVAVEAQKTLAAQGRRIRVVSMPCVEQFLRLPKAQQDEILPPGIRRASFELGITFPWQGLTGTDGINIGVDRFGTSAPWQVIQEKLEVDPKGLVKQLSAQF